MDFKRFLGTRPFFCAPFLELRVTEFLINDFWIVARTSINSQRLARRLKSNPEEMVEVKRQVGKSKKKAG